MGQALLAIAALSLLSGCPPRKTGSDAGTDDGGIAVTRKQVLTEGGACVVAAARDFQSSAVALEQALTAPVSPQAMAEARTAFHAAMDAWQISEAMQVGPAANSTLLGGGDLRDQIYSWPLVSRCAIEETLVAKTYETNLGSLLINRRTLYALEYLLFYEGVDTACTASSTIVSSGSWAALTPAERLERRWTYASKAATNVRGHADALVSRWDPEFLETLKTAGPGNPVFASQQLAINALSDALFYVDKEVRDLKVGPQLNSCASPPCLDLLESQFAARSKRNVAMNLKGFRRIWSGCGTNHSGAAFDDLLLAVGAEGAATRMASAMDGADAALAAIEEPDLGPAVRDDRASVQALYDALRILTFSVMRTEVISILDLEIPQSLEGDND